MLDALLDYLAIPNGNVVAEGLLPANLVHRLVALRHTGFAVVQQNRNAFSILNALRLISEGVGYYAPGQNMIIPKKHPFFPRDIPPDRPGLIIGQNRDSDDGAGGGGPGVVTI
jgi:hypothetical protein